jgi:preprotein translocase subunit SecG
MATLFVILVILASVILGLIVLVQNPKGGGLAGNIAGFSNQFMGVKQTTDVLEKGTWIFAGIIGVLCLISTVFISGTPSNVPNTSNKIGNTLPANNATNSPILNPTATTATPGTSQAPK